MLHPNQPDQIGDWTVKRTFASGSQFTLYIVTDADGTERMAKVPATDHQPLVEREATILNKIDHPSIVKCYDCDFEGSTPFMITDYCFKGPFVEAVKTWKVRDLDRSKVMRTFQPIFDAVGWLHSQGITHGDLYESHIVMTKDDRPMIINFQKAQRHTSSFFDTSDDLQTLAKTFSQVMGNAERCRRTHHQNRRQERIQQFKDMQNIAAPKELSAESSKTKNE